MGVRLRGSIRVPGDKSVSHRAFLIPALAEGTAVVRNALDSEDVARSRALAEAFGATVVRDGEGWRVTGGPPREPPDVVDCGNSGTTMRLGCGVLAHAPGLRVLTGDGSLRTRPMARILGPLAQLGLEVRGREGDTRAPLVLRGGVERTGTFDLPVASAQVKSAILLAGKARGVRVREPERSRDHTERLLTAMGADLTTHADGWLELRPSRWEAVDIDVPGDLSSAAFWLAAAATLPGSEVVLPGVGVNPTRDGVLRALLAMGADITIEPDAQAIEPTATLVVRGSGLVGARIDGELALASLDELPVLAVVAALAEGETVIADAAELRVKESDRIARVVAGLRAFGARVEERPDGMVIEGGRFGGPRPRIDAHGDHRLAMAFAVAGLHHPDGVELVHAESVRTSYPSFFDHLAALKEAR
ncbi:MAG: 3-phosphoshikimate 1-carboxyvinyltransferase [Alphaproteobacteria bacterium]|nr:3-phosphoshikimate 1-carboxyvinyltransferase [Alphaproteobacteria bacterium]MCB9690530.1 3-phosphoshikimate 1-carboxyvinyltransferase [Alphaproteobacteria bacterium]